MEKTKTYYLVVDTYVEYAEYVSTSREACEEYLLDEYEIEYDEDDNERYIIVEVNIPLE